MKFFSYINGGLYSRGYEQFFLLHRRGSYIKWRIRSFFMYKTVLYSRGELWLPSSAADRCLCIFLSLYRSPDVSPFAHSLKAVNANSQSCNLSLFFLTYTKTVFCTRFFGYFYSDHCWYNMSYDRREHKTNIVTCILSV